MGGVRDRAEGDWHLFSPWGASGFFELRVVAPRIEGFDFVAEEFKERA